MGEGESEGAVKIFASLIYFNKCLIGFFTKIIFKQISLESSCNISFKNDFDDKKTNMFLINFFSFFSKTKIPYQKKRMMARPPQLTPGSESSLKYDNSLKYENSA